MLNKEFYQVAVDMDILDREVRQLEPRYGPYEYPTIADKAQLQELRVKYTSINERWKSINDHVVDRRKYIHSRIYDNIQLRTLSELIAGSSEAYLKDDGLCSAVLEKSQKWDEEYENARQTAAKYNDMISNLTQAAGFYAEQVDIVWTKINETEALGYLNDFNTTEYEDELEKLQLLFDLESDKFAQVFDDINEVFVNYACFMELANKTTDQVTVVDVLMSGKFNATKCASRGDLLKALDEYKNVTDELDLLDQEWNSLWRVINQVQCKLDLIEGPTNGHPCQGQSDKDGFIKKFNETGLNTLEQEAEQLYNNIEQIYIDLQLFGNLTVEKCSDAVVMHVPDKNSYASLLLLMKETICDAEDFARDAQKAISQMIRNGKAIQTYAKNNRIMALIDEDSYIMQQGAETYKNYRSYLGRLLDDYEKELDTQCEWLQQNNHTFPDGSDQLCAKRTKKRRHTRNAITDDEDFDDFDFESSGDYEHSGDIDEPEEQPGFTFEELANEVGKTCGGDSDDLYIKYHCELAEENIETLNENKDLLLENESKLNETFAIILGKDGPIDRLCPPPDSNQNLTELIEVFDPELIILEECDQSSGLYNDYLQVVNENADMSNMIQDVEAVKVAESPKGVNIKELDSKLTEALVPAVDVLMNVATDNLKMGEDCGIPDFDKYVENFDKVCTTDDKCDCGLDVVKKEADHVENVLSIREKINDELLAPEGKLMTELDDLLDHLKSVREKVEKAVSTRTKSRVPRFIDAKKSENNIAPVTVNDNFDSSNSFTFDVKFHTNSTDQMSSLFTITDGKDSIYAQLQPNSEEGLEACADKFSPEKCTPTMVFSIGDNKISVKFDSQAELTSVWEFDVKFRQLINGQVSLQVQWSADNGERQTVGTSSSISTDGLLFSKSKSIKVLLREQPHGYTCDPKQLSCLASESCIARNDQYKALKNKLNGSNFEKTSIKRIADRFSNRLNCGPISYFEFSINGKEVAFENQPIFEILENYDQSYKELSADNCTSFDAPTFTNQAYSDHSFYEVDTSTVVRNLAKVYDTSKFDSFGLSFVFQLYDYDFAFTKDGTWLQLMQLGDLKISFSKDGLVFSNPDDSKTIGSKKIDWSLPECFDQERAIKCQTKLY